jgi:phage-related protein
MVRPNQDERPAIWLGGSLKDQSAFPEDVKDVIGHNLSAVQRGEMPETVTALPEYGPDVYEIGEDYDKDTYRNVFLLGMEKGVYILDAFKKKSKSGKAHPKKNKERIKTRIKQARIEDAK